MRMHVDIELFRIVLTNYTYVDTIIKSTVHNEYERNTGSTVVQRAFELFTKNGIARSDCNFVGIQVRRATVRLIETHLYETSGKKGICYRTFLSVEELREVRFRECRYQRSPRRQIRASLLN